MPVLRPETEVPLYRCRGVRALGREAATLSSVRCQPLRHRSRPAAAPLPPVRRVVAPTPPADLPDLRLSSSGHRSLSPAPPPSPQSHRRHRRPAHHRQHPHPGTPPEPFAYAEMRAGTRSRPTSCGSSSPEPLSRRPCRGRSPERPEGPEGPVGEHPIGGMLPPSPELFNSSERGWLASSAWCYRPPKCNYCNKPDTEPQ